LRTPASILLQIRISLLRFDNYSGVIFFRPLFRVRLSRIWVKFNSSFMISLQPRKMREFKEFEYQTRVLRQQGSLNGPYISARQQDHKKQKSLN
ncbi:hypothetical protein, partial [Palaeococcus sp. (in: euryarchaeotes)]